MGFRETVESGVGCVVILAGSGSDDKSRDGKLSHIGEIAKSLQGYGVPYEVRIISAHKQSGDLGNVLASYDVLEGDLVYIAVAGMTDGLSGTASFESTRPVLSCPPDAPNESCLNNPPGSSNLTVYIPKNAARAATQILSLRNREYGRRLVEEIRGKVVSLEGDDARIRADYAKMQEGA